MERRAGTLFRRAPAVKMFHEPTPAAAPAQGSHPMAWMMACANSSVCDVPPTSRVRTLPSV